MLRIGLTGGLASGKSFVAATLERLGCFVVRADEIGHELLASSGAAYAAVVAEFGSGILLENGEIDRRRLAAEVFRSPERLEILNSLIHPHVFRREEELLSEFASRHPAGIGVVEAAILIETGAYKRYDRLILAVCTPEQQLDRAVHRGLTVEEARARLSRQMPLAEKRKYADYVIDTSGAKEDTIRQTTELYEQLQSLT